MIDKVVVITGGAGGIGFEIAKAFATAGARVIIMDFSKPLLDDAANQFKSLNLKASYIECDVREEEQIKTALDVPLAQYGRIDVLINNAGLQHIAFIEDLTTEQFERLLKVMLVAPFIAIKHVFPGMKNQRFGRIINMASVNGLVGFAGKAAYNSAKHGLVGLTKVAALEGAQYGVTINALCPGYTDTELVRNQLADLAKSRSISVEQALNDIIYPLVPQKRLLSAEEIAHYALFLASENSGGITGQAVVIDGGYTAQ